MRDHIATDHFSYKEFCVSDEHLDMAAEIKLTELDKLKIFYMCKINEVLRDKCNHIPIRILSGKRSIELNFIIGGTETSEHLFDNKKAAEDFCFYYDNFFLWNAHYYINKLFPYSFGQCIIYLNSENIAIPQFIHLSLPSKKHIGERLVTIDDKYYTIETAIKEIPDLDKYLNRA